MDMNLPFIVLSSPVDKDNASTGRPEDTAGKGKESPVAKAPPFLPGMRISTPPPDDDEEHAKALRQQKHPADHARRDSSPFDPHTEDEYVRIRHSRTGLDCTTTVACKHCGTEWEHSCSVITLQAAACACSSDRDAARWGAGYGGRDYAKRNWYEAWLHDKAVEKEDPWGFSSTGVSRAVSPVRSGTICVGSITCFKVSLLSHHIA